MHVPDRLLVVYFLNWAFENLASWTVLGFFDGKLTMPVCSWLSAKGQTLCNGIVNLAPVLPPIFHLYIYIYGKSFDYMATFRKCSKKD